MMVREATVDDWPAVTELFLETPLHSGTVFVLDRRPDFGALLHLRGRFHTFLALDGDRLAGTVTALFREARERDRVVVVGEVIDLRVAGWARGGRSAFLLLRAAYEAFGAEGVDWIVSLIGDHNKVALPLVAKRAGFPRLAPLATFASVHFMAWRGPSLPEWDGLTVRAATGADAATIADLSAEALGHELLAPTEPIEWPDSGGLHRAWIAHAADGAPCGMLLAWDADPVRRIRILRYRTADLPHRCAARVGSWVGLTAPLPNPGGVLGLWASRVVTIRRGGAATLRMLLRAALRDATDAGRSVVQLNLHESSPLIGQLPRYPSSTYRSTLYGCQVGGRSGLRQPSEHYYADLARA